MTLDFVQLNAATRGLEGWPIPNIQQTLARLSTLKSKLFGLLDFTQDITLRQERTQHSQRPEVSTNGLEWPWD